MVPFKQPSGYIHDTFDIHVASEHGCGPMYTVLLTFVGANNTQPKVTKA